MEQRLIKIETDIPQLVIIKHGLTGDNTILLEGLPKQHSEEIVNIDFNHLNWFAQSCIYIQNNFLNKFNYV